MAEHLDMASKRREKGVTLKRSGEPSARPAREESLLREVRGLLTRDARLSERFRRLERMESAARVWVNGRALGPQPAHGHLTETYD